MSLQENRKRVASLFFMRSLNAVDCLMPKCGGANEICQGETVLSDSLLYLKINLWSI